MSESLKSAMITGNSYRRWRGEGLSVQEQRMAILAREVERLSRATPVGTIFDSEDESTWPDDRQTVLYRYRNKAKGWVSYLSLFQFLLHISHLPDGVMWWPIPEGMFEPPAESGS